MALDPRQHGTFSVSDEQPGTVIIKGSWATNGSSAIDATSVRGRGFSVARTGVGLAEITYDQKYYRLESFDHSLQLSVAADAKLQWGDHTAPTQTAKGKIVIRHIVGASVAEWPSANANNRVGFSLTFKRTKNI